jgi:hypothetical protein
MMFRIATAVAGLVCLLAACSSEQVPADGPIRPTGVPVTRAALPSVVQPYPVIEEALYCIRGSHVLDHVTFVVGPFADSTGKINAVAPGSTGNFVPQGGSAAYITDAIRKAGGQAVSTYFGEPRQKLPANYMINGIFNSLDFGQAMGMDMRVMGMGPLASSGFAQLSLTIQLDAAGTRLNRQMSMIQRPVRFTQAGVGIGRDFSGTLVTGSVSFQNQERLQLESLNGPIALGVADVVMKEFPDASRRCGKTLSPLLKTAGEQAYVPRQ